jgi:hypothetical protein
MTTVFSLFLVLGTAVVNAGLYPKQEACQSAAKSVWSYQPKTGQPSVYTAYCVQTNIFNQGAAAQ